MTIWQSANKSGDIGIPLPLKTEGEVVVDHARYMNIKLKESNRATNRM